MVRLDGVCAREREIEVVRLEGVCVREREIVVIRLEGVCLDLKLGGNDRKGLCERESKIVVSLEGV